MCLGKMFVKCAVSTKWIGLEDFIRTNDMCQYLLCIFITLGKHEKLPKVLQKHMASEFTDGHRDNMEGELGHCSQSLCSKTTWQRSTGHILPRFDVSIRRVISAAQKSLRSPSFSMITAGFHINSVAFPYRRQC